ncbi:MAG: leucine-rich repeat protein [Christensenellaceae bacterium]|jgi:uncharacterized repeat protein (TIGR02543 family)|nr:leucine-rich repeat protein [Christensenellaceae bacterium]
MKSKKLTYALLILVLISVCAILFVACNDEIITFNITLSCDSVDGGQVTSTHLESVAPNTKVTIEATPNEGYLFLGWYDEENYESSKDAKYEFLMPEKNVKLIAKFALGYTLTLSPSDTAAGSVSASKSGQLVALEDVVITAIPTEKYSFVGWYDGETEVSNLRVYTLTMPANNLSIVAKFALAYGSLSLKSSNDQHGSVESSHPLDQLITIGTSVTIRAVAKNGYQFYGWFGSNNQLVSDEPQHTFTFESKELELTARFAQIYTITVVRKGPDDVVLDPVRFYSLSSQIIGEILIDLAPYTAYSDPNLIGTYYFDGWLDEENNVISNGTKCLIPNLTSDATLYTKYSLQYFDLRVTSKDPETGSVTSNHTENYPAGAMINITSSAAANYELVGYYLNDEYYSVQSSDFSVEMPKEDCKIELKFQLITSVLNIDTPTGGNITSTVSPGDNIPAGESITITASPNANYAFVRWEITDESNVITNNPYTFTMPAKDCSVSAVFLPTFNLAVDTYDANMGTVDQTINGTYVENSRVTLTAKPVTGYNFSGWYNGTTLINTSNDYTYKIDSNITITARFIPTNLQFTTVSGKKYVTASPNLTITDLIVPDIHEGISVIGIDSSAFYNSKLTSVVLPSTITIIKSSAFASSTSLTSVTLPESLTTIESAAFQSCTSLTSIALPSKVTSIAQRAFYLCSALTTISIDGTLTSIGELALSATALTSFDFNDGLQEIGKDAFTSTKIESIILPNSVTTIGEAAFQYCSSATILVLSQSLTSIPTNAFSGCSNIKEVIIPSSVQSIGYQSFRGCTSLELLDIRASATSLPEYFIYGCTKLTDLVISATITGIHANADADATNITSIYYAGNDYSSVSISTSSNIYKATVYYYSEIEPNEDGNYWRYVDGKPLAWAEL